MVTEKASSSVVRNLSISSFLSIVTVNQRFRFPFAFVIVGHSASLFTRRRYLQVSPEGQRRHGEACVPQFPGVEHRSDAPYVPRSLRFFTLFGFLFSEADLRSYGLKGSFGERKSSWRMLSILLSMASIFLHEGLAHPGPPEETLETVPGCLADGACFQGRLPGAEIPADPAPPCTGRGGRTIPRQARCHGGEEPSASLLSGMDQAGGVPRPHLARRKGAQKQEPCSARSASR